MRRHQILLKLKGALSPSRLEHTLGVEMAALGIARMVGEEEGAVSLAALLHDCAKCMDAPRMLRIIDGGKLQIDPITRANSSLLHAHAAAVLAREVYHVKDERVLDAIRWHTTGRANMSRLCALLYLADVVEPYREPYQGLEEVREAMKTDLNLALRIAVDDTIAYVTGKQKQIHPDSLALRGWLASGARPFDCGEPSLITGKEE